jgi:FkbM family methyltransferase
MPRTRGPLHRVVRRIPGVQAAYRELRIQRALRRGLVTLDYPNAAIRMHATTRSIARLRLDPTAKEPWTVAWIESNLRQDDVLWDVGANVGAYALIAAAIQPEARVVAVEPGYANYAALCENVVLNGVESSVLPVPAALAESSRSGTLALSRVEPGAAIHALDAPGPAAYAQPVLVHALDDLVELHGLPPPTLLKVDVDGSEARVLAGATAALRRPELRSAIVEVEAESGESVVHALVEAGFSLVERIEERDGVPLPGVWYGVFERRTGA